MVPNYLRVGVTVKGTGTQLHHRHHRHWFGYDYQ